MKKTLYWLNVFIMGLYLVGYLLPHLISASNTMQNALGVWIGLGFLAIESLLALWIYK
jgi:hypothetical protein